MSEPVPPPSARPPRRRRPEPRRLAAVLALWALLVAGAVVAAAGLDRPTGGATPDESRPLVGDLALPGEGPGGEGALPPLAMVPAGPAPEEIAALPPSEQIAALRREAGLTADTGLLIQLGALHQRLGNPAVAAVAFRDALRVDPDDVGARVGLAVNAGAQDGEEGLRAASRELDALARAHPGSQVVAFNRGWVAIYRSDGPAARAAFEDTLKLGRETPLGETAGRLLAAVDDPGGAPRP